MSSVCVQKTAPPVRIEVIVLARTKASAREYALKRPHYVRGLIFNMQLAIIQVEGGSVKRTSLHSGVFPPTPTSLKFPHSITSASVYHNTGLLSINIMACVSFLVGELE